MGIEIVRWKHFFGPDRTAFDHYLWHNLETRKYKKLTLLYNCTHFLANFVHNMILLYNYGVDFHVVIYFRLYYYSFTRFSQEWQWRHMVIVMSRPVGFDFLVYPIRIHIIHKTNYNLNSYDVYNIRGSSVPINLLSIFDKVIAGNCCIEIYTHIPNIPKINKYLYICIYTYYIINRIATAYTHCTGQVLGSVSFYNTHDNPFLAVFLHNKTI